MNEFRHLISSPVLNVYDCKCAAHQPQSRPRKIVVPSHMIALQRTGFCLVQDGEDEYAVDSTQAIFLNPGREYAFPHPDGGGDRATILSVSAEYLRSVLPRSVTRGAQRGLFPRTVASTSSRADLVHRQLIRCLREGMPTPVVEEITLSLVRAVIDDALQVADEPDSRRRDSTKRTHRTIVNEMKRCMSRQLGDKPSLDALAAQLQCSPFHLSRIFHRHAGMSASQYYQRLRLRTALERILESEDGLTSIADELGFTHHSHLTNSFKREYGVPPSTCRQASTAGRLLELTRALLN